MTPKEFLKCSSRAKISPETLQDLKERLGDIFSDYKFQIENMTLKYENLIGDQRIEPNLKYKNYYKKVFNPKQIASPFTAGQLVENPRQRIWIYLDQNDKF